MKRNVIKTKLENVPNLFICTSFGHKKGDVHKEHLIPLVSFMLVNKEQDVVVEWEVTYGPITRIERVSSDWSDIKHGKTAVTHWFLGYCKGFGDWAQTAVTERALPQAVLENDFEHIASVLADYL